MPYGIEDLSQHPWLGRSNNHVHIYFVTWGKIQMIGSWLNSTFTHLAHMFILSVIKHVVPRGIDSLPSASEAGMLTATP